MAVTYSCDNCEKEFNLQIKLKKHIASEHQVKDNKSVDYTDEDLKFTDDEKAQYYDDLKSKYDELKKKLEAQRSISKLNVNIQSSLEQQTEKHQTDPRKKKIEKKILKKKRVRSKVSKEFTKDKLKPNDLDWIDDTDDFSPESFKVYYNKEENRKKFKVPDSALAHCSGLLTRVECLRYMKAENYSQDDIDKMKKGLIEEDGWNEPDSLPKGWLLSKHKKRYGYCYLSPELDICTVAKVIQILENSGSSKEDIHKFKAACDWEENINIPRGWMSKQVDLKNDGTSLYTSYLSPDGKHCIGIISVLKYFIDSDNVDTEDYEKFVRIAEKEGWQTKEYLPSGWYEFRGKDRNTYFTDKGIKLRGSKKALEYMVKKNYSREVIKKFNTAPHRNNLQRNISKSSKLKSKFKSMSNTMIKENKKHQVKIPGNNIRNKEVRLNKKERHAESDDKKEEKHAESDEKKKKEIPYTRSQESEKLPSNRQYFSEFTEVDYLPSNWKVKGYPMFKGTKGKGKGKQVKTPSGVIISGFKEVISYMIKNGYSEADIDNFKENGSSIPYRDRETLPPGWKSAVVNGPNSMRMTKFLSPNGHTIKSRGSAIRFMIENNYDEDHIDMMKKLLVTEDGWIAHESLPDNWMMRKDCSRTYLSPTFETFRTKAEVMTFMRKQGSSEEIMAQAEKFFNSTFSRIKAEPEEDVESSPPSKKLKLDETSFDWKPDSDLPSNWMSAMEGEDYLISNQQGDIFKNRKEAIDYMIKNEHAPSDIFRLWNNLYLEGWHSDEDYLPPGWKRKYSEDKNSYHYLSPLMETLESSEDLLKHISDSSNYTIDDVNKIKSWIYDI